jgi:hypothetical protein
MLELDVRTAPTQASHVGIEVDVFPQMHRKKQSEQHLRIRKAADRRYQAADIELRAAAAQPVSPHPPQLDSTRFVSFRFTTWPTGKRILQRVFFLFAPCLTQV